MPRYLAKRGIWLLILLLGALLAWQLLAGVGDLLAYFQEGADPGTALNIVPNVPVDIHVSTEWRPDDHDTGRKMEDFSRGQIEASYLQAWLQWNLSLLKNAPFGLKTYFAGPALADLDDTINATAAKGWQVEQVDTNHILQLHVYAADGSIVSFSDLGATIEQVIHDKSGNIVSVGEQTATYDVVMLLEDGNWRIRHMVRTGDAAQSAPKIQPKLQTPRGFVGRQGKQLILNNEPYRIAGMNYYPAQTPWDKFWPNYQPTVIEHDFTLMQRLGLNTIRIFLPFRQFGGADIANTPLLQQTADAAKPTKGKTATPPVIVHPLEQVSDLLQRASNHKLHVIITLFDFRSDYSLLHWPEADRQLETLLTYFKNTPSILAWDLKNEADLDWRSAGKRLVNAWLEHSAKLARRYDPHHLLTVGWSNPLAAQTQIPNLDLISFHYYAKAEQLAQAFQGIQQAQPDLPIALTEFGIPTWNSPFFPNGHTEAEQAEYYADLLGALRQTESAGYVAWTLYDFTYAPATVAGGLPWQSAPQKELGVVHINGKWKQAAYLLAPNAQLKIQRVPAYMHYLKPFWITTCGAVLLSIVGGYTSFRLRKKRQAKKWVDR